LITILHPVNSDQFTNVAVTATAETLIAQGTSASERFTAVARDWKLDLSQKLRSSGTATNLEVRR